MKKKWDRTTMRFAAASYVERKRVLDVTFENGDHFLIATESLLPIAKNGQASASRMLHGADSPDWARLRIGETGDMLEVPASDCIIEIPWDRIRSVADPEFRGHLTDRALERAQRIGSRIRALRLEGGLTRAALAEKLGIARLELANLEAGKIEPTTDLVERIAFALGRRLRDFAEE